MPTPNTILVADDEPALRATLAAILQKAGYSVTAVGDAHTALQTLQAGPFDLVFLDLKMPGMDGLALLAEMRRSQPDMAVLILTGHATLKSSIEAVRLGARDYLLKPIDPPLILARVHDILGEARRSERRREILSQITSLVAELQEIDGGEVSPASLLSALPVAASASARFLQRGPLTLDLQARHAILDGRLVAMPPGALDYLVTLVRHAPDPVTHEALVMQSQGYQMARVEAQELVRWRMHQLRQALEPDPEHPRYILTVRGIGYRLAA
jgi:two-component system KDP operon response regulator KdpE